MGTRMEGLIEGMLEAVLLVEPVATHRGCRQSAAHKILEYRHSLPVVR